MAVEQRVGSAGGKTWGSVRLGHLFGIEIRLDPSVLLMFALIVITLAQGLFVEWHPDWSKTRQWTTALFAASALLGSLLTHELAHALAARSFRIRVPRITLFLFGGAAEIESDAETPGAECVIALAGPLLSLTLAIAFAVIGQSELSEAQRTLLLSDPAQALASSGPLTTACLWLASINLMLALFNLIPGFPLDGGRVLRALVWRVSGNFVLATRVAGAAGQYVGWLLMLSGVWLLLGQGRPGGLWYVFLGWFLSHLARASLTDVVMRHALGRQKVRDLMQTRFDSVDAGVDVHEFVEQYLLRGPQTLWPVREQGIVTGMAGLAGASRFSPDERWRHRVIEIMEPLATFPTVAADARASEALPFLAAAGDSPVPVLDQGVFVGFLRGRDILRWTAMHPQTVQGEAGMVSGSAGSIRKPRYP